ncbi:MAG: patatin family protein [Lachnospiraceae bacterium]|nr:patatin family protein [Lachnospiraceae bacterium]
MKKYGLVMEGGGMRGLFTAGVLDVLMEKGIVFDGAIGVSAGACFGCNIKSVQPGRAIRYNKRFARDPRYSGFRSLVKTGDIFGAEFAYHVLPFELDLMDIETYRSNPMEFWLVATDLQTGEPVYHRIDDLNYDDLEWMRASASMPGVSRIVSVGGRDMLDGGMTDSIPLRFFETEGYLRNVVILTQPSDYVKKPNNMMPVIRRALKDYPKGIEAMEKRHIAYNKQVRYAHHAEEKGRALIIQPETALGIRHLEHNPDEMQRVYDLGREAAEKKMDELRAFMS